MAIVSDLVTRFKYEGSLEPLDKHSSKLMNATKILGMMATGMAAAIGGMAAYSMNAINAADHLDELSNRTGVAVEAIQKLDYVAIMNGSSAEAMESSLEGLNRQIGLAATGGDVQAEVFKELGISIKDTSGHLKTADAVFLELNSRMGALGYSTQEQAAVLRKLRLDHTLVETLGMASSEMQYFMEQAEEMGLITSDQAKGAGAMKDALAAMQMRMSAASNTMALSFMPTMINMIEGMTKLWAANRALIMGGIDKLVGIAQGGIHVFQSLSQVLWGGTNAMMLLGAAVLYLNKGLLKQAAIMLLNPATWLAAAFVGLLLIVDDLVTAFNGGESVIGSFLERMFGVDAVKTMHVALALLLIPIDAVLLATYTLTGAFMDFMNLIGMGLDTRAIEKDIRRVEGLANEHLKIIAGGVMPDAKPMTPLKPAVAGGVVAGGLGTQNNNIVNNFHGVSDPQKAADLTGQSIKKELQAAKVNGTRGGQ